MDFHIRFDYYWKRCGQCFITKVNRTYATIDTQCVLDFHRSRHLCRRKFNTKLRIVNNQKCLLCKYESGTIERQWNCHNEYAANFKLVQSKAHQQEYGSTSDVLIWRLYDPFRMDWDTFLLRLASHILDLWPLYITDYCIRVVLFCLPSTREKYISWPRSTSWKR